MHKPNYIDPETRGDGLFIGIIILTTAATIAVAVRLWVRGKIIRKVWVDDYLIVASLVSWTYAPPVALSVTDSASPKGVRMGSSYLDGFPDEEIRPHHALLGHQA